MTKPLNILVVDDTVTYRLILKEVVSGIPGCQVSATANNGEDALKKLGEYPVDLVLMDLEMPQMDGIEAMRVIRKDHPGLGVVMISGANAGSANLTMRALEAGAIDFIRKPEFATSQENLAALRKELIPIIEVLQARRASVAQPLSQARQGTLGMPAIRSKILPMRIDVIVIGVSTGGPKALMEVIPALPPDLKPPVLIVQHMPPLFTASLADGLNQKSALTVKEAKDGEVIQPGFVYIAPGGLHMVAQKGSSIGQMRIGTHDGPLENSCRPAVDVLFRSVAEAYGEHILAVVMTGMGQDGAKGVSAIKQDRNCYCLTQSADTCVVYGMPKAVDDMALSDESVPLPALASRIAMLASSGTGGRRAL